MLDSLDQSHKFSRASRPLLLSCCDLRGTNTCKCFTHTRGGIGIIILARKALTFDPRYRHYEAPNATSCHPQCWFASLFVRISSAQLESEAIVPRTIPFRPCFPEKFKSIEEGIEFGTGNKVYLQSYHEPVTNSSNEKKAAAGICCPDGRSGHVGPSPLVGRWRARICPGND